MAAKQCSKCGEDRPLSDFSTNGAGILKSRCKPCRSADQSARYARKPIEAKKAEMKRISGWVKLNPEKYRQYARATRSANPEHYKAKVNQRRRRNRLATVAWADKSAIAVIYRKAIAISKATGIRHEVDHIVPIISDIVCGLHCEANLRVLPLAENRSKGNRVWPDMP